MAYSGPMLKVQATYETFLLSVMSRSSGPQCHTQKLLGHILLGKQSNFKKLFLKWGKRFVRIRTTGVMLNAEGELYKFQVNAWPWRVRGTRWKPSSFCPVSPLHCCLPFFNTGETRLIYWIFNTGETRLNILNFQYWRNQVKYIEFFNTGETRLNILNFQYSRKNSRLNWGVYKLFFNGVSRI